MPQLPVLSPRRAFIGLVGRLNDGILNEGRLVFDVQSSANDVPLATDAFLKRRGRLRRLVVAVIQMAALSR